MKFITACILLLALPLQSAQAREAAAVSAALDRFHAAAAQADFAAYFAVMTEDAVFLGTDGSERWQGQAFRDYVKPRFDQGHGWTYVSLERHIELSPDGQLAWFDESLRNQRLGPCRGSGVLVKRAGQWQLAQYSLSVPIPNAMVLQVADAIAAGGAAPAAPAAAGQATPEAGAGATVGTVAQPDETSPDPAGEPEKKCRKRFKTNRAANC